MFPEHFCNQYNPDVQTTESFWQFLLVFSNPPENHLAGKLIVFPYLKISKASLMYLLNLLTLNSYFKLEHIKVFFLKFICPQMEIF